MITTCLNHILLASKKRSKIQRAIYQDQGFFIFKNFISQDALDAIKSFWLDDRIDYFFHDKLANKDVSLLSPPYLIKGKKQSDKVYCTGIWNEPLDDLTHEVAYQVGTLRNIIENKPIFFGLHLKSKWILQYRVCRSVSGGTIVNRHADFMEEYRADSTGSHAFDPVRLQATLVLSKNDKDYSSGGFYLEIDGRKFYSTDIGATAGDLILWKYNIPHGVDDIMLNNENDIGFMRIIFPSFELGDS